ncbi:MAG: hypothetical protein IKC47_00250 [Clostridia bacterium]|nr:hypothetical protein [Clostridia bacterium]
MQNQPTTPVKVFFDRQHKNDYYSRLYHRVENKPEFILLEYPLHYGDVSNIPHSNAKAVEAFGYAPVDEYYSQLKKYLKALSCLPTNTPIEIFVTEYGSHEIVSLYYFAKKFSAFSNVCVKCVKFNQELEIVSTTPLTKELIKTLAEEWEAAASSEIRLVKNNKLVSYDAYDAMRFVYPLLTKTYQTGLQLFGKLHDKYAPVGFKVDMDSFFYVLQLMIDNEWIERTHSTDTMSGYPDLFPEQGFRILDEREYYCCPRETKTLAEWKKDVSIRWYGTLKKSFGTHFGKDVYLPSKRLPTGGCLPILVHVEGDLYQRTCHTELQFSEFYETRKGNEAILADETEIKPLDVWLKRFRLFDENMTLVDSGKTHHGKRVVLVTCFTGHNSCKLVNVCDDQYRLVENAELRKSEFFKK